MTRSLKFKKKTLQALDFLPSRINIRKTVNEFISESPELITMTFNNCLALVPLNMRLNMEFEGWHDTTNETHNPINEIEIKEEGFDDDQSIHFGHMFNDDHSTPLQSFQLEDSTRKRKRPPVWLKKVLDESKSEITMDEKPMAVWNCSVCKKVSCATYTGMKMHVLKSHGDELMVEGQNSCPPQQFSRIDERNAEEIVNGDDMNGMFR